MRILVFGIHPDDIELGCGGSAALHARSGHEVVLADLTRGESSSNGTPQARALEAEKAARIMGCRERINIGLPDAGIRSEDPDQQRRVVETIRRVKPDVVLLPNGDDPHPDHESGAALIRRALYLSGVHGYRTEGAEAWKTRAALVYSGRREVRRDVVVDTTAVHDIKMDAIRAHESQFTARADSVPTPLNAPDFLSVVEARDRTHGYLVGARFGEAFETLSPVPVEDFGVFVNPGGGKQRGAE